MDKLNWKKYLNIILLIVLTISVFYNISSYLNYKKNNNLIKRINESNFLTISSFGNNLANKLEEFVDLTDQQETSEMKSKLDDLWRIVIGQNKSITSALLLGISAQHIVDEEHDWSLLQYSLSRVDEYLFSMTIKFLEQRSYTISSEEREILEAIISIYRIFEQKAENDEYKLTDVLQAMKEPMLLIDYNYKSILDLTENKK